MSPYDVTGVWPSLSQPKENEDLNGSQDKSEGTRHRSKQPSFPEIDYEPERIGFRETQVRLQVHLLYNLYMVSGHNPIHSNIDVWHALHKPMDPPAIC